jgi:glycosyltransferase involved in cell wall biosynthesis
MHVMKMCQAFGHEGYDVTLIAPRRRGAITVPDVRRHYGLTDEIQITYLERRPILRDYDVGWMAARLAKAEADLVYTRNSGAALWSTVLGVPTVYETHSPPRGGMSSFHLRFMLRRGLVRLVVISRALESRIATDYGRLLGDRMIVAPDGVDLERFVNLPTAAGARATLDLPLGGLVAGYAGHLYPGRGVELILELARRLPDVYFLLVGGLDEAVESTRRAAEAASLANVRAVGFVPNADLPTFLAACDVLLMPYQRQTLVAGGRDTAGWMSPMKMFEYMACGRLIVSSDLPVLREVLHDGNAVLCDPDNVEAWEESLRLARDEPAWRSELALRAKAEAGQYSWRARVRRVMAGIASAMNEGGDAVAMPRSDVSRGSIGRAT